MEVIVENDELFLSSGELKIALPGYVPKITETGPEKEILNEANILTIEKILSETASNPDLMATIRDNIKSSKCFSDFTCLVIIMPLLCMYYETPKCDFKKLQKWAWEHLTMMRLLGKI